MKPRTERMGRIQTHTRIFFFLISSLLLRGTQAGENYHRLFDRRVQSDGNSTSDSCFLKCGEHDPRNCLDEPINELGVAPSSSTTTFSLSEPIDQDSCVCDISLALALCIANSTECAIDVDAAAKCTTEDVEFIKDKEVNGNCATALEVLCDAVGYLGDVQSKTRACSCPCDEELGFENKKHSRHTQFGVASFPVQGLSIQFMSHGEEPSNDQCYAECFHPSLNSECDSIQSPDGSLNTDYDVELANCVCRETQKMVECALNQSVCSGVIEDEAEHIVCTAEDFIWEEGLESCYNLTALICSIANYNLPPRDPGSSSDECHCDCPPTGTPPTQTITAGLDNYAAVLLSNMERSQEGISPENNIDQLMERDAEVVNRASSYHIWLSFVCLVIATWKLTSF